MKDTPNIAGITVVNTDGRWQYFSAKELSSVLAFAGAFNTWKLLEFITSLAPEPLTPAEEPDANTVQQEPA